MTRYSSFLPLMVLSFAAFVSAAAQKAPCKDPCGKVTSWEGFNSFSLKASEAGQSAYSLYQGKIDKETGDMQIDLEDAESGTLKKGRILLIGGRLMATQGPIIQPGYEIDTLDGAVLQFQLLIKMLGRALPGGPKMVDSSLQVNHSDEKTGIEIATPSAGGMMQPPWRVVGELKRLPLDTIEYQLNFTSSYGRGQSKTLSFLGRLFNSDSTKIDDQMSLADWTLFGVGPQSRKQGNTTTFDYSAAPDTNGYQTVAQVRKKLASDDYPGEADSSKDFTGFWKTDCQDAFGLQIKHIGTAGKYSVVFCGPGGCMDPENEGRKTFISQDPHYQVVSESELKTPSGDGWQTYHRCTKDAYPVLKYKK